MIQDVGLDMVNKHVVPIQAHPDFEPRFSILDGIYQEMPKGDSGQSLMG